MNKIKALFAAGAAAVTTAPAFAAGEIDTTAVTDVITSVGTAAGLIGVAVLGVIAAIKGYKMVRGAM